LRNKVGYGRGGFEHQMDSNNARVTAGVGPNPLNLTLFKTAMFIAAHPDDIEACVGGIVWQLTQQNTQVIYVIVTNGDKGCGASFCENWTSEHIAYIRQLEQYNASLVLNVPVSNVVMLDFEDAMLTSYPEQDPRQQLVYQIRKWKPDVVFTWYPYPDFTLEPHSGWDDIGYHPDHQKSGKLTLDAHFDAGIGLLWPAAGEAWSPEYFYFWSFTNPTDYIPLNQNSLNKKIEASLAHKSQYPDPAIVKTFVEFLGTETVSRGGIQNTKYAEAFISYW